MTGKTRCETGSVTHVLLGRQGVRQVVKSKCLEISSETDIGVNVLLGKQGVRQVV